MKRKRYFIPIALLCLICFTNKMVLAEEIGIEIMVSLGDSYASGEGIEPFYGQGKPVEQKIKDSDWLAHRSQNSWSSMLRLSKNDGTMAYYKDGYWVFAASSGAETKHFKEGQEKTYSIGGYSDTCYLAPQLDAFKKVNYGTVDYVTLSIGGNDAGFVDILIEAILADVNIINPYGFTDKIDSIWEEFEREGGIRDRIKQTYSDISSAAGPQACIIVTGYPKLLNPDGVFWVSSTTASYVNTNVSQFNRKIKGIVDECRSEGMNIYFVSVEEAFDGHEAYTDFPYLNGVEIPANSEDLNHSVPFSAYSIHPNYSGACVYAEEVQKLIDELEKEKGNVVETRQTAYPNFSIIGTWKSVGEYGFGQAQPGATVTFDGTNCNFYSPNDTYEFYLQNNKWKLQTKNMLWGDVLTFDVEVIDDDNIQIIYGSNSVTELTRIINNGYKEEESTSSGNNDGELLGTYVCYSFGVIKNSFTFYEGNRVSMNALGIEGEGTYEIRGDKMIIKYTTNISGNTVYELDADFARDGDTLYIDGGTFVKQ